MGEGGIDFISAALDKLEKVDPDLSTQAKAQYKRVLKSRANVQAMLEVEINRVDKLFTSMKTLQDFLDRMIALCEKRLY